MPEEDGPGPPREPAPRGQPEVADVLRFDLSHVALGPDYPATEISAEIGRVAIAAARVDQEYALLLQALHAGNRAEWDFADLRKLSSGDLRARSLRRVKEFFEGQVLKDACTVVQDAYTALERRHAVMHTVWTLTGPDAMTPYLTSSPRSRIRTPMRRCLRSPDATSKARAGVPLIRAQLVSSRHLS